MEAQRGVIAVHKCIGTVSKCKGNAGTKEIGYNLVLMEYRYETGKKIPNYQMKVILEEHSSRNNGRNSSVFRDNARSACGRNIIIYMIVRKGT